MPALPQMHRRQSRSTSSVSLASPFAAAVAAPQDNATALQGFPKLAPREPPLAGLFDQTNPNARDRDALSRSARSVSRPDSRDRLFYGGDQSAGRCDDPAVA